MRHGIDMHVGIAQSVSGRYGGYAKAPTLYFRISPQYKDGKLTPCHRTKSHHLARHLRVFHLVVGCPHQSAESVGTFTEAGAQIPSPYHKSSSKGLAMSLRILLRHAKTKMLACRDAQ